MATDVLGVGMALAADPRGGASREPPITARSGCTGWRSWRRSRTQCCCSAWRSSSGSRRSAASAIRPRSPRGRCSTIGLVGLAVNLACFLILRSGARGEPQRARRVPRGAVGRARLRRRDHRRRRDVDHRLGVGRSGGRRRDRRVHPPPGTGGSAETRCGCSSRRRRTGIDIDEVRAALHHVDGVADVHDLHLWTLTSEMDVVTAHIAVAHRDRAQQVLDDALGMLTASLRVGACDAAGGVGTGSPVRRDRLVTTPDGGPHDTSAALVRRRRTRRPRLASRRVAHRRRRPAAGLFDGSVALRHTLLAEAAGVDLATFDDRCRSSRRDGRACAAGWTHSCSPPSSVRSRPASACVPTITTTHTEPFHVSKNVATLDWVSGGRAAGGSRCRRRPTRRTSSAARAASRCATCATEAADAVEVARRLWDSWEDDAIIRDARPGRFIDRDKVHYIDFVGRSVQRARAVDRAALAAGAAAGRGGRRGRERRRSSPVACGRHRVRRRRTTRAHAAAPTRRGARAPSQRRGAIRREVTVLAIARRRLGATATADAAERAGGARSRTSRGSRRATGRAAGRRRRGELVAHARGVGGRRRRRAPPPCRARSRPADSLAFDVLPRLPRQPAATFGVHRRHAARAARPRSTREPLRHAPAERRRPRRRRSDMPHAASRSTSPLTSPASTARRCGATRTSGSQIELSSFVHLARTAERGKFDFFFLAEGLRLREHRGRIFDLDVVGRPDSLTILAALAGVTTHLGLAATLNTTFNEPYELARQVASLDHLSGGRAAWNAVTSPDSFTGENFRRGGFLERDDRYDARRGVHRRRPRAVGQLDRRRGRRRPGERHVRARRGDHPVRSHRPGVHDPRPVRRAAQPAGAAGADPGGRQRRRAASSPRATPT